MKLKEENRSSTLKILMPEVISKYKEMYKSYSIYLSDNFFEDTFIKFCDLYSFEWCINFKIAFSLFIQNKINEKLCQVIKDGDIDLEIELIDKYMPILDMIVKKLGYEYKKINKEDILISALETYDGESLLSLYIVKILKKTIRKNNATNSENEKVYIKNR